MMTKADIQTVLDALVLANGFVLEDGDLDAAINLCVAKLAEPSEAVLYVATDALEYIAAGGVRIEAVAPCSDIAEDGQFVPLFTRPASNHLDEIAKVLHYPDCWDVMAYPTLEDAIIEAKSWAHCTNDDCQCPTKEAR